MEAEESATSKREKRPRSITFYVVFAAALYAVIRTQSLLAPILLSFILIILITLAMNPIVQRLRAWTGGRKRAAGLITVGLVTLGALAGWAAVVPLKEAASSLSEELPAYWARLQKPLIKMEQKGVISEEKLQVEVSAEIAREAPETEDGAPAPPRNPLWLDPPSTDLDGNPGNAEGSDRLLHGGIPPGSLTALAG